MSLNEKAVKELLGHLVFSHTFHSFEAKDRAEELLAELDTAHNDETVAAEAVKKEEEAKAAQVAEDAAFAERVRRYNEANAGTPAAEPVEPVTA